MFNDTINSLELTELPLRDHAYMWSNKCDNPTLVCLDWAFINQRWSDILPNTSLFPPDPPRFRPRSVPSHRVHGSPVA